MGRPMASTQPPEEFYESEPFSDADALDDLNRWPERVKDQFLYPIRTTSAEGVTFQQLAFSANLQEFSQRVSLVCALASNGKLTPQEAFEQIQILWLRLNQTKETLLDHSSTMPAQPAVAYQPAPSELSVAQPSVDFSVIIPTYNRRPILEKCLAALTHQQLGAYEGYEVIVVDDGSTDGTVEWLTTDPPAIANFQLLTQEHQGPAAARNLGIRQATGKIIIFIDSDLVVVDSFLAAHAQVLKAHNVSGDPHRPGESKIFTYGRVINTCNFDYPQSEPFKPTDFSAAFFATGNVAIARYWLDQAAESAEGPFDTRFSLYGWEDLELGVRLKKLGLKLVKCPAAAGYHWHPPFSLQQIPQLIDRERQRGRMGVLFYQKHPTWEVRLMIQMTPLHQILWGILSLGGWLNEHRLAPLLRWMIKQGRSQLALELCRICFLNWYNVKSVYEAYRRAR